jgi:metal-responsive CopG/Arc/MetJ family transcriptional regulator
VTEPDEPTGNDGLSESTRQQQDKVDPQGARTSAMQAVSARLPAVLVEQLTEEATKRGIRPSELIRQAIEALLRGGPEKSVDLNASAGNQMTVVTRLSQYQTENPNLVVEVPMEPSHVVALGYSL